MLKEFVWFKVAMQIPKENDTIAEEIKASL